MSSPATDAGFASSQHSGARCSQGGLDAGAKAWAAQLLLLVMQAYVIMADDDLPDWISRLIKGRSDQDLIAGVPPSTLRTPVSTCCPANIKMRAALQLLNIKKRTAP